MDITFLGTGAAWCIPEHSCACAICEKLNELGEERTRTSFLVRGKESILVDCGPDIRNQMRNCKMERPDLVLITHEHGDHYLGLDDLVAFRRSVPVEAWRPIPVYATETAWKAIEVRFGYLIGSLITKKIAAPGEALEDTQAKITPFKTFHGPSAAGSVGYVIEDSLKLVYTSDFMKIEDEPEILFDPDILIIQSHWFNEPEFNRPSLMSFQRAVDYIRLWKPKIASYLVHISDGDLVPDDPGNSFMKKRPPGDPLKSPQTGMPYPIPRCQAEWQSVVNQIGRDYELPGPIVVAQDGLSVSR
jgi:phosphoribosyl 1,2-cyclic phosphate phosphodiesterase